MPSKSHVLGQLADFMHCQVPCKVMVWLHPSRGEFGSSSTAFVLPRGDNSLEFLSKDMSTLVMGGFFVTWKICHISLVIR